VYKKARLKVKLAQKIKQETKEEQRRLPYVKQAVDMWHDYEELVFNLSENSKNETIASIKKMTLGHRMKYAELLNKKIERLKSKGNGKEV